MNKEIKSEYATMLMVDGVLEGKYNDNIFVDIDVAKMIIEQRKKASNYQTIPILVDAIKIKGLTKEARNHFGSEEGYDLLSAAAILTDSVLSTFIVNFFIKVNLQKASIPVKMFTNKEKALKWLNQYK